MAPVPQALKILRDLPECMKRQLFCCCLEWMEPDGSFAG